ncbi:hypothetical protein QE152_g3994 [Popillia japonica]|uniref:Uncharacterized protein n=1 Tax=Popillia japonica TaxID=7064 RepID=A0AAW1N3U1_POPJA
MTQTLHICQLLEKTSNLSLLDELEKDDIEIPEIITILPPENANADCDTDDDSADEGLVVLNNLPGPQLTAEAEIQNKAVTGTMG